MKTYICEERQKRESQLRRDKSQVAHLEKYLKTDI